MLEAGATVMKNGAIRATGWMLCAALLGFGTELAAQPVSGGYADFGGAHASGHAYQVANWIVQAGDHQDLPFVVVDKIHARVFVFNSTGRLLGVTSALLGLALGDESVAGIGDRPLSSILPSERTTPAGRFVAALGRNLSGHEILWVDYEQGISLHPVRSVNAKERRLERLASSSVQDKRISYGCINVPKAFFHDVVVPVLTATQAIVYVLPETLPLRSVFVAYDIDDTPDTPPR
jgi:hypothetical protein